MRTSYTRRDTTFSQAILELRTTMVLTQHKLGALLGLSRQAVGEWEASRSFPKTEHLKALIVLAIQRRAFPARHETEAIHALWKKAHQKQQIDEHWLDTLLDDHSSSSIHLVPPGISRQAQSIDPPASSLEGILTNAPALIPAAPPPRAPLATPRVDWGGAPTIPTFYGREEELALLTRWVMQEHCHVVNILGMGGIGKSVLLVKIMYQLAEHFEVVIFRSLRDAPPCEVLLDDCLQMLALQSLGQAQGLQGEVQESAASPPLQIPATLEQRLSLFLQYLRETRALVVLDNMESLLLAGDVRGHFRLGFDEYERLLHRVIERDHQSCLLLTSREGSAELKLLEGRYSKMHSLHLAGLDVASCQQILGEKDLIGTQQEQEQLIAVYGGNPLALKIVAETVVDLFGGEISEFLTGSSLVFGNITDLLDEQFVRLSPLERTILYWLAIAREPMALDELLAMPVSPPPSVQILEAIEGLRRRSLIERGKQPGCFTLQSVVLEYVTAMLIQPEWTNLGQRWYG